MCFYPLQGTVYMSNLSFVINHRKPARFIVIGASIAEGYDAMTYARGLCGSCKAISPRSSATTPAPGTDGRFGEPVAGDSGAPARHGDPYDWRERPDFRYPASQWQGNYSNLVAQLQANGVNVKHCLPTPETTTDQRPLKTWLSANYPASDVIDDWTPLVTTAINLTRPTTTTTTMGCIRTTPAIC